VEPADGEVINVRKPVFTAKILDDVDPASVRMFLGDRPLKNPLYDPATGKLRRALRILLPRGGHLVTLRAVDRKGVARSYSWYFRIKKLPVKKHGMGPASKGKSAAPPATTQPETTDATTEGALP
jgi:hypothetical protein